MSFVMLSFLLRQNVNLGTNAIETSWDRSNFLILLSFPFSSINHLMHTIDVEGRIFILIAERTYPVRAAHACLEEFQRSVSATLHAEIVPMCKLCLHTV